MTEKLRVYAESGRARPEIYWVTEAKLAAALARHPDLADRIAFTAAFDDAPDAARLAEADALIGSKIKTATLRARAPRLRWVHSTSAGVEGLAPFDWLGEDIALTNSSGIHGPKAGEFGLMALLALNDNLPIHVANQRERRWNDLYATPIKGKTAVVVGTGSLGGAVAEQAARIGVRVVGVNRSGAAHPACVATFPAARIAEAVAGADFLVGACPLTPLTRGLVSAAALARLKAGAGVVNIGRAAVFDMAALAAGLRAGAIGGAILDVFEVEPLPPDSEWWTMPRTIVVPHVSSDDPETYVAMALDVFMAEARRRFAGQPFANRVDPALGY